VNYAPPALVQGGMAFNQISRVGSLALVAMLSGGCDIEAQIASVSGSFERTLPVTTGPVSLTVTNGAGDIRITPGTDGAVHVIARISAREFPLAGLSAAERVKRVEANPPVVQDGNTIRLGEIADRDLTRNLSIDYEITVPAQTSVTSKTGSGDQQIGGIAGPVEAVAGSGDLTVGPLTAGARVVTGSGDIDVLGAAGDITMTAGSGDVRASQVSGRLAAKTGSGDIDVDGRPDGDWTVGSGSGDIALRLPGDARFTLEASTSSGSVEVSHPLDATGTQSRRRAAGTARGGGPRIALSAASGSIRVD
jgi:hypothetical protein